MKNLSKSKLIAFRQCPKRLWLEVHREEVRADSASAQTIFKVGHTVGELARRLYDPEGVGNLIDVEQEGYPDALARTQELLNKDEPIFEAGFSAGGVLAFADVMVKRNKAGKQTWHVVEVKSSGSLKSYQRDDVAIQLFAMRQAGVCPGGVSVAHVDGTWVYPGHDDYAGIFKEVDLTVEVTERSGEVEKWVSAASRMAASDKEPDIRTGAQCSDPFACGFIEYCKSKESRTEFPVEWIPKIQRKALKEHLAGPDVRDMRQIPDDLLSERQLRVKTHTLENRRYFDAGGAAAALLDKSLPAYFLDFETIMFTVPIWAGTRPFQQIPFQFSLHIMDRDQPVAHREFIDLSGTDPSKRFADALVAACGKCGPIHVYNAGFEATRIRELAKRFTEVAEPLDALLNRIVDLRPIMEKHYYHPAQEGSWSIKSVLPTIAPELGYDKLQGVSDGGAAMAAYLEAISAETSDSRKKEIGVQLREYCKLDTLALVRLWKTCSGWSPVGAAN